MARISPLPTLQCPVSLFTINSLSSKAKIVEFANSIDLDEEAHHEPPNLDLHCLPSSL